MNEPTLYRHLFMTALGFYSILNQNKKRNDWLEHYQKVIDASPPRSFEAVKYLITTELMKNDKDYHELVNDESDDEEQRWSDYDDMILRYKLLKEHGFKKNDGSTKLPKKKPGKKATNSINFE